MPDRGDSLDSNESDASSAPANHHRSSLYARFSELQTGNLVKPRTRTSFAQADDTETSPSQKSAEETRMTQGITSNRHRSQSAGPVFALAPGSSKEAMLQELGLVTGSSSHEQ